MFVYSISHKKQHPLCVFVGILLLDSDVFVSCETLRYTHSVWRSASTSMAGFFPRLHTVARTGTGRRAQGGEGQKTQAYDLNAETKTAEYAVYEYFDWLYVWWNGQYSLLHSAGAELHRDLWQVGGWVECV